jgi:Ca2+-binding RTX toxin-like protein
VGLQSDNQKQYFDYYLDRYTPHTSAQGGTYSNEADAVAHAQDVEGLDLIPALDALREDGYASGFRLIDPETGSLVGEYITLQLDDGRYVTIERGTLLSFDGGYDQIVDKINRGTSDLDLSHQVAFLNPLIAITARGEIVNHWQFGDDFQYYADLLADRIAAPAYSTDADGNTVRIDVFGEGSDRRAEWHYFDSAGLQTRTETFFRDITHDRTDYDPTDALDWSRQTWNYTANDMLEALTIVYDDGTRIQIDYDPADVFDWYYRQSNFSAVGDLTQLVERYQDGTNSRVDYDPTNVADWSQRIWNYTADQALETLTIAYDDGTRIQIDYDPADVFAWNFRQSNFNAAGDLTLVTLRNPDGTSSQIKYFYGLAGNDTLTGGTGTDVLVGRQGADVLIGGAGADALFGGSGVDVASYETATAGVTARLDHPNLNAGDAAGDTYSEVESLRGSSYADLLCGDAAANMLAGRAGNDSLWGYGGGDTFDGGDGNDYLVGAAGADTFIGGAGIDTVSYYFAAAGLTARLDHPNLNTGEALGDSYNGVENLYGSKFIDTLCGNAGANVLTGREGNDSLWGYGGGDTFDGGDGNDYLVGAAGADTFIGGAGIDTVSYNFATSGVVANLAAPAGNTGEAAGDSYSGIENILGSAYNDTLTGNSGSNFLQGGKGNDTLIGGAGSDALSGGEGRDTFVFRLGEASGDVITDFLGNGANPGDQLKFEGFGTGATFTSIDATHWQVNYNGGTAHEIITFSTPVSIHSTDVIFA